MTPKEKAEQLLVAIFTEQHNDNEAKKIMLSTPKIALLLADEMISTLDTMNNCLRGITTTIGQTPDEKLRFWESVKFELEKINKK